MLELLSLRKGTTLTKEMSSTHLYGGMDEPELEGCIGCLHLQAQGRSLTRLPAVRTGIETGLGRVGWFAAMVLGSSSTRGNARKRLKRSGDQLPKSN